MRRLSPVVLILAVTAVAVWAMDSASSEPAAAPLVEQAPATPAPKIPPAVSGQVLRELMGRQVGVDKALVRLKCGDAPELRTLTRRGGMFSFSRRRAPVGECQVSASAPGLSSGTASGEVSARIQIPACTGQTCTAQTSTVDVRLRLYGTAPLSGRVIRRGLGIEGTRLSLVVQETPMSAVEYGQEVDVVTDEEGRFTIPAVGPGLVRILADHDMYGAVESEALVVDEGVVPPELVLDLTGVATVFGVVRDAQGAAVEGAEVRVVDMESDEVRVVASDALGAFRAEAVPAGPVQVCASGDHFEPAECQELELNADGEQAVELVLTRQPGIRGRVLNASGDPVEGAEVLLLTLSGEPVAGRLTTDALGRFFANVVLADVQGPVVAEARHPDFLPSDVQPVRADEEVEVRLKQGGRVVGRVLDGSGAPVSRVSLVVTTLRGQAWVEPRELTLEADGSFDVGGFPSGVFRAVIGNLDTPATRDLQLRRFAVTAGRVTQLGTLRFEPTGVLVGRVVDTSGQPIQGARVRISDTEPGYTDAEGAFRVEGVVSGATLYVESSGYKRRLLSHQSIFAGRERDLGRITLKPLDGTGSAEYSGIGSAVSAAPEGGVLLTGVFPGSPADRAGIATGSVVVGVDGHDVTDLTVERAIESMLGPAGTSVTLTIVTPEGDTRTVRVQRADVVAP